MSTVFVLGVRTFKRYLSIHASLKDAKAFARKNRDGISVARNRSFLDTWTVKQHGEEFGTIREVHFGIEYSGGFL